MSESYTAPRSTNKNKNDKESKNTGLRRFAAGLALASIGVTGGGAAVKHVYDKLQAPEVVATAEVQEGIDSATKDQLILLQAANDGDKKIASHNTELLNTWKHLDDYAVTIEQGGTLSEAVLDAYKKHHSNEPSQVITPDIINSITITTNSYVERERAEGGDGVIQPGVPIAITEVQSADNHEYVVVSRPLEFSTD